MGCLIHVTSAGWSVAGDQKTDVGYVIQGGESTEGLRKVLNSMRSEVGKNYRTMWSSSDNAFVHAPQIIPEDTSILD